MYQKRRNMENMLIWLIDIFCILCSSALAFWIRYGILYGSFEHGDQAWLVFTMCLLYILINVCVNFNHHFSGVAILMNWSVWSGWKLP